MRNNMNNPLKIYSKIQLLVKNSDIREKEHKEDSSLPSTTKIEFEQSTLIISGDYLIIQKIGDKDEITGIVFNLKEISSYKVYNDIDNK